MKIIKLLALSAILLILTPFAIFSQAPNLGATSSFALFTGAGAFNNTGTSIITGDIGTNVGAFSGFPPGIVIGQIHVADGVSAQAAADVQLAYASLSGLTCGAVLGVGLGNNQILTPNIYCTGGATTLNGNLVLDGQGNPNAIFVFQIDGALSTGTFSSVTLINLASLCNVYWQVNGAFALSNGSVFRGTLIANGAISLSGNSSLLGRGLATAGAISTENNVVTIGLPPIPSTIISSGPPTFCAGGSITLSGNDNGGTWSTGATTPSIVVTVAGDYFVTNTSGCGTAVSNHIVVIVNPIPNVNAVPNQIVCNGSPTLPVNFSGTVPGTVYNWVNNSPSIGLAATGSGNILSFNAVNSGIIPIIATIIVTPSYTNAGVTCTGTPFSFSITVNPNPLISPIPNSAFCTGAIVPSILFTSTTPGVIFNWSRTGDNIGLIPLNGTGSLPSFTATNLGNSLLVSTITVTSSITSGGITCPGVPVIFTISVDPNPIINPIPNQIYCAGAIVPAIIFNSTTPGVVFNWSRTGDNIGLIPLNGTGSLPSFTATNTGPSLLVSTITVTSSITAGGITCNGTPVVFTISVDPNPLISPIPNSAFCTGAIVPSIVFTSTTPGVIFNWSRTGDNIGLIPLNGTGSLPSFTATNLGNSLLVSTITVTSSITAGGITCPGIPVIFTISVNPTPIINPIPNQVYCTGATVPAVIFSSATPGVIFNWSRTGANIGLVPLNGTGSLPSFIAVNASITPLVATITVIPSFISNGITCSGTAIQFTITVNPVPQINALPNIATCNNTLTGPFNFSSTIPGTIFNWTNNDASIGLGASGTGNIPQFIAINLGPGIKIATIIVTASFVNGGNTCNASTTFTITISPPPVAICKNVTLILNTSGQATLLIPDLNNGSTGGIITVSKTSFNCSNVGVNTVILTVTDACSNTSTCSSIVTVIDNLPPSITAVDTCIFVQCDAPIPAIPLVVATDNCSATLSFIQTSDQSPWTQLCEHYTYRITRIWIATDPSGNTATVKQVVKVIDTIAPVLTMLPIPNGYANCDEGQVHGCPIPLDNCDQTPSLLFSFHYEPYPGACANSYIVVRKWIAGDKCGNTSFVTQNVYVADKQAPELTCPANIVIKSTIPITVNWPMPKAWDDCDGGLIAVQLSGPKNGSLFAPGTTSTIVFEATDNCGNTSTCSFTVTITKDIIIIKGNKISGAIKTLNGKPIENSVVSLTGDVKQFQDSKTGTYEFIGIEQGATVDLGIANNQNPLDGVSTLDFITITNHIIGKKALDSPYKLLAADVNASGNITTSDLVEMRKLILHITDKYTNSDSWKFLPATTTFTNPLNPWASPIKWTSSITNIQQNMVANFTGVKMGDVSGDATGKLINGNIEVKDGNSFHLYSDNRTFKKGEVIDFLVTSKDANTLIGMQFTLDYDKNLLEYVSLKENRIDIGEESFGLRYLTDGRITGSMDLSNGTGEELFTLQFIAKEDGELRKSIQLNSKLTEAEAYTSTEEKMSLNLLFIGKENTNTEFINALYQNEPNPFDSYTTIRFSLIENQEAVFSIFDLNGKLIKQVKQVYNKGDQAININKSEFPASGIYYYQLKTSNFTELKKMMFIQ